MDSKKKIAAAMAAVMTYIKAGEAANAVKPPERSPYPSTWSISGRLAHMDLRNMMQLKVFK